MNYDNLVIFPWCSKMGLNKCLKPKIGEKKKLDGRGMEIYGSCPVLRVRVGTGVGAFFFRQLRSTDDLLTSRSLEQDTVPGTLNVGSLPRDDDPPEI